MLLDKKNQRLIHCDDLRHSHQIMANHLLYPRAAHVGLTAFLYVMLTVARAPTVWGWGRRADGSNPWAQLEPRISANLSNQFEWPVLFYVACLAFPVRHEYPDPQLWLAWAFVAGRIAHSGVQVFTANIRLRGMVFTINFIAVLGMWSWPIFLLGMPNIGS